MPRAQGLLSKINAVRDADGLKKAPIMADDQQRPVIIAQCCLQRSKAGNVEMIGRFIQDQQLRRDRATDG